MTAEQKKSPRKSKTFFDQEKYTAELSSGQLVLGVIVLLVFGLACFMLGIVVGKVEQSDPPRLAQSFDAPAPGGASAETDSAQPQPPATEGPGIEFEAPLDPLPNLAASGSSEDASGGSGVSESEPDGRLANDDTAGNWNAANSEGGASGDTPGDDRPNHVSLPALDSTGTEEPKPSVRPQVTRRNLLAPVEPPEFEASAAAESSQSAGRSAEESSAGLVVDISTPQGDLSYSVQVMALADRQKAIIEKAKIEARSDYAVRLKDSPSGRLVHVLVGAFATKSAAESAKEDIRKNLDYTDAYVRKID